MIKNQEGFIPLVAIVCIVVATTIFGGSFFLSKEYAFNHAPQSIIPVTEDDFENIKDPILRKHFVTWANQKNYQVKTTASQKKGYTLLEVQKNGNSNYRSIENDGSHDISETISLNDMLYVKDYSDNSWWKQIITPLDSQDQQSIVDQRQNEFIYNKLPLENCGNKSCYVYEETYPQDPQAKRVFLFDNQDYLLRKEDLLFGEFKITNEYYYKSTQILPPFPIKNIPNKESIYGLITKEKIRPNTSDITSPNLSGDNQVLDLIPDL